MLRVLLLLAAVAGLMNFGLKSQQQEAFAQPASAPEGLLVVELFTSQGCSSCPPADRVLRELVSFGDKHQLPIYCLSFHVDYWNSLGWKDPYSSPLFTQRQRQYSMAFGNRSIYTPQMIVNGKTEFVGSRGKDVRKAIQSALATPATSTVKLKAQLADDGNSVQIEYAISGHEPDTTLNVALVQKKVTNQVPHGENAGRKLAHVQVVRTLKTIPLDNPSGKLRLELPADLAAKEANVVAYVQNPRSMQISGAAIAIF